MFILFLAVVAVVVGISAWVAAQRRKALSQWAAAHGLTYSALRDHGMDSRLPEFQCLQRGDNRYAYNIMEGAFHEQPFLGFDYHYETHSRDSKGRRQTHHHHFSAVLLGCGFPLEPLSIRPEGFFDKVTEFFGHDDIDFESAEFSRKFYVTAPDKRWAYDVIHARTMEFLLSQPMFTLQFGRQGVIAHRNSRLSPADFEAAANVIHGIIHRLPEYLVKQLLERNRP